MLAMCIYSICTCCAGQRRQLCGPGAVSVLPLLYGLQNRAGSGDNKIQNMLNIKENLKKTSLFVIGIKMQKRNNYWLNNRENIFSYVTRKFIHSLQRHCIEKFETNIPRNTSAGSRSQFLHSCTLYLYSCILYLQLNRQTDPGNI
jgi:hypothetical protein